MINFTTLAEGTYQTRHLKTKKLYTVKVAHNDLTKYPLAQPTLLTVTGIDGRRVRHSVDVAQLALI